MTGTPPTVYILHGDDQLAAEEFLQHLHDRMGDPAEAQFNIQRFNADKLDFPSLEEACASLPFLSRRRMVILQDPAHLTKSEHQTQRLIRLLDNLPTSTALILIQDGWLDQQSSPILQWSADHPDSTFVRRFTSPRGPAFVHWIIDRCQAQGGAISPQAASLLAELVGDDSLIAAQEITKLLDFVDHQRPIEATDVEKLTPFHGQSDVFAMVDSVGHRDGAKALAHLHRFLEDESPIYAFAMIVRQFRLLLQAREALDQGLDPVQLLATRRFVARKITDQAASFSLPDLEAIYRDLLQIDIERKTGGDLAVLLDTLVARLST